ncbi:uncharacterized protein At3g17950 [Benincasa hispida]|uniref:uncharacterized protein At3g17950 n=1 Tax=Benincasa hispida TaxID=102211 RepID=UPI0018FF2968|nr:uncharacterized protein At3g17950 [Benincasa hispida]
MLNPANDLLPPPSSPTNSSISSSDLDTESTGSFFHDRSTSLGTLMGVSFPAITFRVPSQNRDQHTAATAAAGGGSRKSKKTKRKTSTAPALVADRKRRWWRLCRDDGVKPASLGEFLEVERRFGDGAFYGNAVDLEGVVATDQQRNGRSLFADGRVLPPAETEDDTSAAGALCRFSVSLTGICSGGAG